MSNNPMKRTKVKERVQAPQPNDLKLQLSKVVDSFNEVLVHARMSKVKFDLHWNGTKLEISFNG